jgi:hypothetical protein
MRTARLVVIELPPEEPTPGILWELDQVAGLAIWDRLLVVTPPLRPQQVRDRWGRLWIAVADRPSLAAFALRLPDEPARILTLRFRAGSWTAGTAAIRNEWTYAQAIRAVVSTDELSTLT